MPRIITLDDTGSTVIAHMAGGTKREFESWDEFIAELDIADVETYVDVLGNWWHQDGVEPLTAYPEVGDTKRPEGQGCMHCAFFSGCLATEKYRGQRNYVTETVGLRCTSWEVGIGK